MEPPSSGSFYAPSKSRLLAGFLLWLTFPTGNRRFSAPRSEMGSMCRADDRDANMERVTA
ncbi:hypothetical protein ACINK0_01465 [Deinococcus sp. VB343]|uniref:Uncharacterized protein n=1 Tax=Deinococcus sp. VB142 TaxID=3112952 RepID=A0AAU6Q1J1_9DEIO